MLRKEIEYENFNGEMVKEPFYFNFTKAELTEMQITTGGVQTMIQDIVDAKDHKQIVAVFKDIILKAVGEKSPDGKFFMKSPEISARFAATNAYSELFMELSQDAKKASEFFNAIVPQVPSDSKVPANNPNN